MTVGISLQRVGGYAVQYTDEAQRQKLALEPGARNRFESHMHMVAAVNPYIHGESTGMIRDRRITFFEDLAISFWVFQDGFVVTVVDVRNAPPDDSVTRFNPFVGFGGEDADDD